MKIKTAHFGEIEYDMGKKLYFGNGLPGLEEDTEFALLSQADSEPIYWMQSLIRPKISLPVLNPFLVCPTYSFDIADSDIDKLQIADVQDVCILNVLVIPNGHPEAMTINLTAPIILNMKNRQGRQILLDDKNYGTRMLVSDLITKAKAVE
jgi:flagellar assembly factor FliW